MDEARGRALAAGFSRGIGEAAAALGALGYASVARARDGASASFRTHLVRCPAPWSWTAAAWTALSSATRTS